MNSIRGLEEAKRIFDRALEIAAADRPAFLETACASNSTLRGQVEQMLAEFERNSAQFGPSFSSFPTQSAVQSKAEDFAGTRRFAVQRRLGSGAFGAVFQVWDREQQATVALKLLHSRRADSLFRFKREFRSLVSVRHPNLVRLHELFSEGERWFFTMDLIEGETFFEYVRPAGGPCRLDRLRLAMRQLAEGVEGLHAAKRLHRDLKPSNVLVTSEGRVVVLDFGLVRELDPTSSEQSLTLVGTPAYMPPEQALHMPLSAASDWYSVGVMFFQALTGKLPYPGSFLEMWTRKSQERAPEPRQLDPATPQDLNELCRRMLEPLPENRLDGQTLLAVLAGTPPITIAGHTNARLGEAEYFVGRTKQLAEIKSAFAVTQEGQLSVVLVEGPSGIGKSTLVRQFLATLAESHPNLIAFEGRCYEFESVPYKGLDALVDELSQYLQRLPEARMQALLPRDAFLLPRLFPVLGRVKAIATAPARSAVVPDAQELRQRTFAALREMLARLADRHSVVIWIDDLQWGDRDSSAFLADLCAPPQQPPLLLLLTYRSEELANPNLQYLHRVLIANQRALGKWRQVTLEGLSNDESRELLRNLVPQEADEGVEAKILSEAAGHPLFLQELARFAASSAGLSLEGSRKDLELRTVLQRRVAGLPPFAREVLELISIAVQPLPMPVLFAAASSGQEEERAGAAAALVRENLARVSGAGGERSLEPFHDQVRGAVMEMLTPKLRRARHAQLASVLSVQSEVEPQVLVTHYLEAGDLRAAHEAALMAAEAAEDQLAFDRAAVFYEAALATCEMHNAPRAALHRKLADSLGKAGRGRDSAYAYLKAAESRGDNDPLEMRRLAADQLMRSGYIDEAMELLAELAERVGIRMVHNAKQALAGIMLGRLRTRARLLMGLPKAIQLPARREKVMRLEVLRTGGVILNMADPVLATYFQVQYVLEALRVRDPIHLATALALESSVRAATGTRRLKRPLALMKRAEEMAVATGNPNALGLIHLCRAYLDYLLGWIPEGIRDSRRTIEFLREHCTGVAWELTASHVLLFFFTCWAGQVGEVRELLPQLLKEGAARGDVNVEVSLRLLSYVHYYYLSADEPDECIVECRRALARWSEKGFHLQHYGATFAQVESYLYVGDYAQARQQLLANWEPMSRSIIMRWQILTVMALFLRGRVALACWLEHRTDEVLRAEVECYAKRLKRINSMWCDPMASTLLAGLAAGEGRNRMAAETLERAYEGFEKVSLHAYASAAAHFCGLLRGDEQGRTKIRAAADFLESQQVRNPAAFLRMLLPGKWL